MLNDRTDTSFVADASFRIALAKIGLDELVEARDLIVEFIRKYPTNPLRASAELTLGNVIEMLGDSDTALEHYKLVDQYTDDRGLEGEAEMKMARILVYQQQSATAVARLSAYIERYRQYLESIPVASALAGIYKDDEQPRVALSIIKETLDIFFESTDVSDLDPLLIEFIQHDRALRDSRAATYVFFDTVSTDAVLLEELIRDRAAQYRYFRANPSIETVVKDSFVQDDAFRMAVIAELDAIRPPAPEPDPLNPEAPLPEPDPIDLNGKSIEALLKLEAEVAQLNEKIPTVSADEWLGQHARAVGTGRKTSHSNFESDALPCEG